MHREEGKYIMYILHHSFADPTQQQLQAEANPTYSCIQDAFTGPRKCSNAPRCGGRRKYRV